MKKMARRAERMQKSAGYLPEMRIVSIALSLPTFALLSASALAVPAAAQRTSDRNVILVVTDGLRWQEVFTGADSALVFGDARALGGDTSAMRSRFWGATPEERRAALMPFLWSTIAGNG